MKTIKIKDTVVKNIFVIIANEKYKRSCVN